MRKHKYILLDYLQIQRKIFSRQRQSMDIFVIHRYSGNDMYLFSFHQASGERFIRSPIRCYANFFYNVDFFYNDARSYYMYNIANQRYLNVISTKSSILNVYVSQQ